MFLIRLIREAASIYAILMLVSFIVPYVTSDRRKWMDTLDRICAPGVRLGKQIAEKIFPDKSFNIDVASLAAVLACWVIKWVLGWFL